ncbi:sn-1-specific diacylglycerol lipase ABHD11 [Hippocampus comes]|uniref:sn-1-specific diacylglycerol lipase ABHD11 n=1 Tax=Hippocampus comes TaxID=109280 RepID=A0A3Q2YTS4_HIPCM|nr:PREDICTED: protein ABHD11 [Hippocampus comes]
MSALRRLVRRTPLLLPNGSHRRTSGRLPAERREASSASSAGASPVDLTYDVFDGNGESAAAAAAAAAAPLNFLHGLFGSKSNFHSIAKSLVQRTGRKVLTVDARNHGNSPHDPQLTYEAMSGDLAHLLAQLRIDKCVLIGHSMGGKTAMTAAITQPALVERLVVVDVSPARSDTATDFHSYVRAMRDVDVSGDLPRSTARRVAEDQLRRAVKERSVRHFLLSNLVERDGRYVWRLNLDAISAHLRDVSGFPAFGSAYHGPTLFLGGASSGYISSEDYPEIERLFPRADIQYIPDAGHWVHADKPLDFISSVISFLQS